MQESDGNGRAGGPALGPGPNLPLPAGLALRAAAVGSVLLLLFLLASFLRGVYTNILWFSSLGHTQVYITVLSTQVWLFVAGFATMGLLTAIVFRWAWISSWGPSQLDLTPGALIWLRRALLFSIWGTGAIVALSFATALGTRWEVFLRFVNASSFGRADPIFGLDVAFYTFVLPVLHTIQGWLMAAAIVLLVTIVGLFFLVYSVRGTNPLDDSGPRRVLTVLAVFLMLTLAAGHFLDTYETLFSTSGAVTGATATDVSVRIPMLRLLTAIAILAGLIMLLALRSASAEQAARIVLGAFGLWVVTGLVGGLAVPMLYQRFAVSPSELEREREYIGHNIEWTRYGFGLDHVTEEHFDVREDTLAADIALHPETIDNIRLWDPRPLLDVYNQLQHLRLYYSFSDVDVDRYLIDGTYRQVLLGTRELSPEGLDPSAQNWVNRKLVYTHGYGVVMSPATDFTSEGQPEFYLKDVPPTGIMQVTQPRVYYGETAQDFVIVNSREAQFDRPPAVAGGPPIYIDQYDGSGGVALSSFARRVAYAWEFADINVLISGQVTPKSRVLYRRAIRERIETIAPFLRLDRDPYMVVDEGSLFWIQDAYTTTDRLPYAKRLDDRDFNYVRNSVKVVVNAYDGAVTFYTIESHSPDPILATYQRAFPNLFRPITDMPDGLRRHLRYPEVLLRAQAQTFLQYHMTDPKEFFLKEDQWAIPEEVFGGQSVQVDPYYVIMKLPRHDEAEFVMILPFTPQDKPNLVGWMAARSDGSHYGDILIYTFPTERQFNGPSQVEARIDNDPGISEQFTLWGQSGSTVIRGNLLVIPVGESLLYAEPIYLQAESLNFPELKRVVLATADHVVMEPTLELAVNALIQRGDATKSEEQTSPGNISPNLLRAELERLRSTLNSLREDIEALDAGLEELEALTQEASP